jgi:hypothetical protein
LAIPERSDRNRSQASWRKNIARIVHKVDKNWIVFGKRKQGMVRHGQGKSRFKKLSVTNRTGHSTHPRHIFHRVGALRPTTTRLPGSRSG